MGAGGGDSSHLSERAAAVVADVEASDGEHTLHGFVEEIDTSSMGRAGKDISCLKTSLGENKSS